MISEPGKITGRITLLGAPESCFYHLDGGGESVLLGGGMAYLAPRILPQIEAFGIDVKKITKVEGVLFVVMERMVKFVVKALEEKKG